METNQITERIIGAAIRVHSQLGPGLLESIYKRCLAIELAKTGLHFQTQFPVPVFYDGKAIGHDFFVDVLVEQTVVVELKAVDRLHPVHTAQLISYLRLARCEVGLLINFNVLLLPQGIKRVVREYDGPLPRVPRLPRP